MKMQQVHSINMNKNIKLAFPIYLITKAMWSSTRKASNSIPLDILRVTEFKVHVLVIVVKRKVVFLRTKGPSN